MSFRQWLESEVAIYAEFHSDPRIISYLQQAYNAGKEAIEYPPLQTVVTDAGMQLVLKAQAGHEPLTDEC